MLLDNVTQTLQVAVQVHGIGISEERRQQLFSRFDQAHREGSFGGLGLGLYISHQIIELHADQITSDFPEKGGTHFVILPPTLAVY